MSKKLGIILGVAVLVIGAVVAFSMNGSYFQGKISKGNQLTVSLGTTPSAQTVKAGTNGVNVASWDISAKSDVKLDELLFYIKGITPPDSIESVHLKIGTTEIAKGNLVNSKIAFKSLNYSISKGTTKNVSLWVDLNENTPSSEFKFILRNVVYTNSITAAKASQTYSLTGPTINVIGTSNTASPSLTLSLASTPVAGSTEHVKGEKKVKFVGVSAACGEASDCKVTDITLTGDFDEKGLASQFTAGESNSVKLNSIVGSVWLEDTAGNIIAAPKPVQSTGAVPFTNVNWTVKKGEKAIFYVVGDLSSNGYANGTNDNISFVTNAASDVKFEDLTSGSTYDAKNSVNADNKVYVTVINGGTLSIDLDASTPNEDIVIAGTEVPVSTFKVTSTKEPYVIKKLALKNRYDKTIGDTDNNINVVKISYTNSQGQPETKINSLVNGKAQFSGLDMLVSKDSDAKLQISASLNPVIQGGGGSTAGEMISLNVIPENFEAVAQTSGETLKTAKLGSLEAYFMHVYSAKPIFTLSANSPSGSKTVSATGEVFAFNITNTGKSETKIKNLVFDIASDGKLTQKPAEARLKSGTNVVGLASVEYINNSSAKLTFDSEFTIDKSKQLTLEVSTIDLMSLTPGEDFLIFSIDYGSSIYGNVTPGDVTWENEGKSVQWLGNQNISILKSNTLKY